MNWTYTITDTVQLSVLKQYLLGRAMWAYPVNIVQSITMSDVKQSHLDCLTWMIANKTAYMYDWPGFALLTGWNINWKQYLEGYFYDGKLGAEFTEPAKALKGSVPCLKAAQICIDNELPYEMRCWFCPLDIQYINTYLSQYYPNLDVKARFCHSPKSFGKIHIMFRSMQYKDELTSEDEDKIALHFLRYRQCCTNNEAYKVPVLNLNVALDFANHACILSGFDKPFIGTDIFA
jgi:hypothetical protein